MKTQRHTLKTLLIFALGSLLIGLFGFGCSTDTVPSSPVSSSIDLSQTNWGNPCEIGPEYCYPPVPANGPAPGWNFVNYKTDRSGTLDDPQTMIVRTIRAEQNGIFNLDGNQLVIPSGAIPGDQLTVSMATPAPGTAIVDFGPHGTQFNSPVILRLSIADMDLPEGMTGEDLAVWYINDAGEYVLFNGTVTVNGLWLETTTNHFSRYIIAMRSLF